jgi:hypothetical protein
LDGRFFVDTDANGVVPLYQNVILQFCEEAGVCTADEPPVSLGALPPDASAKTNAVIRSAVCSNDLHMSFCKSTRQEKFEKECLCQGRFQKIHMLVFWHGNAVKGVELAEGDSLSLK